MAFARDLTIIRKAIHQDTAMAEVDPDRIDQTLEDLSKANDASGFLTRAMALFATAGNGHTRIIPNAAVRVFPFRLIWAGDALWAVDRDAQKVTTINGLDVGEVFSRMAPLLAGNAPRRSVIGGLPMAWPAALEGAGVPIAVKTTFGFADGSTRSFSPDECRPAANFYPHFETGFPDPQSDPYATDHPNVLRLATFTTEVPSAPDQRLAQATEKVAHMPDGPCVIDLRGNPGGDFLRHLPILDLLAPKARTHPMGVLVDRFTFSAAIVFAALCHKRLHAPILGEPMGDRPRFHAEGGTMALPDTGAHLRWSDGYHDWETGSPRATTPPEIAAEMTPCGTLMPEPLAVTTPADIAIGRDPALTAAFHHLKGHPTCAP